MLDALLLWLADPAAVARRDSATLFPGLERGTSAEDYGQARNSLWALTYLLCDPIEELDPTDELIDRWKDSP